MSSRMIKLLERMDECLKSGNVEEVHYMIKTELDALKRIKFNDEEKKEHA